MALNQHQAVTFNEGEPLDPVKLNKLAANIDNLYKSIGNQTTDGVPTIPVVFSEFYQFSKVKPGEMKDKTISFGNTFFDDEVKAGKVFATVGLRSPLDKDDNVTVSISGITSTPTIYVVNNGKDVKTISVDLIAIVMREL